jgi:hypothetical protein
MGCWTSLRGRATCYPVLVVLVCLVLGQHFRVHGCGHSFYHDQAVATVQDYLHYKPLTEQAVGKVQNLRHIHPTAVAQLIYLM